MPLELARLRTENARSLALQAMRALEDAEAEAEGGWAGMALDAALRALRKAEEASAAASGLEGDARFAADRAVSSAQSALMRAAGMVIVVRGSLPDGDGIPSFVRGADWTLLQRQRGPKPAPEGPFVRSPPVRMPDGPAGGR